MRLNVEDLIERCVSGHAARDVIKGLEEELPDSKSVRSQLLTDFRLAGVVVEGRRVVAKGSQVKVTFAEKLDESSHRIVTNICDTYLRTYPEIEVLVSFIQ